MKILFITSNRIGDAMLSSALLPSLPIWLKLSNAQVEITVVCGELAVPIFEAFPMVNKVIPLTKQKRGQHWSKLFHQVKDTKWDSIIDCRNSITALRLSFQQRRLIKSYKPKKQKLGDHQVETLFSVFPKKDKIAPPAVLPLYLSKDSENKAKILIQTYSLEKGFIALGIGANSPQKIWPIERFVGLIQKINCELPSPLSQLPIVLLGDKNDYPLAQSLITQAKDIHLNLPILNLCGQLDLMTNAAILKQANLFIGNDSGLMHLAAASCPKVLGLFNQEHEQRYRPYGINCISISSDISQTANLLDRLSVEMAFEKLKAFW